MIHVLTLCATCPLGQGDFIEKLAVAGFEVRKTACMSGCTRPSTVAFRAIGKTAYLFGDIEQFDLADLLTFARAYLAAPDGNFPDARMFGTLRAKAIARIPG